MNVDKCANCLMHGWKEVEDESTLQGCKRCKVVKYCGKDCQTDHWKRLHHKHCKQFLDPTNAQKWIHKEEDCLICREAAVVGESQIRRPENPIYECIFKVFEKFPPHLLHPHQFPTNAQSGNTYENTLTVLWQLLNKFLLTQLEATFNCQEDMFKVFAELALIQLRMWGFRKTTPEYFISRYISNTLDLLDDIGKEVERTETMSDPFELWKTIKVLNSALLHVRSIEYLNTLINPLKDIPDKFHAIVSKALDNSSKFLAIINKVLEALAIKVVPFEDVLKIICEGSLQKTCTFCSEEIIISSGSTWPGRGPTVYISSLYSQIYICDSIDCLEEANSLEDLVPLVATLVSVVSERKSMQCDFCFGLPPTEEVHRCSRCLSVMYCSSAVRTARPTTGRYTRSPARRMWRRGRRRMGDREGGRRRWMIWRSFKRKWIFLTFKKSVKLLPVLD